MGRELTAAGLVYYGGGNASMWTPDAIHITREGALLSRLTEADITTITRMTEPPTATPAFDAPIHRAVYVATGARAVLHAHPPHVVALSFGRQEYTPHDLEGRRVLGTVQVVSPRRSVIDVIAAALEKNRIVMVAGHGTYAWGADLWECLHLTSALEWSARIALLMAAAGMHTPPPIPANPASDGGSAPAGPS
ncbi:MAG: class II aldolase/adducin family protein [Dehalococcoidia bacterium]